MYRKTLLLFLYVILNLATSEQDILGLPPKLCKIDEAECILEAAKHMLKVFARGIPEYRVAPMDPLYFETVDVSGQNLKLLVNKITITGVKDCEILKFEFEYPKATGQMVCDCVFNGQYLMDGQLLVIPIKGEGAVHAEAKLLFGGEGNVTEYKAKDGKTHWKIKTFTHSYELKSKPKVMFENLFNGNEILRKGVEELLDKNPEELVYIVGDKAMQTVANVTLMNINHYFKALPTDLLLRQD